MCQHDISNDILGQLAEGGDVVEDDVVSFVAVDALRLHWPLEHLPSDWGSRCGGRKTHDG